MHNFFILRSKNILLKNIFYLRLRKNVLTNSYDLNGTISTIYKANPSLFDKIVKKESSSIPSKSEYINIFDPPAYGYSYICAGSFKEYYQVSFKRLSISINGYKIMTESGNAYLRSWNFSGSNNGKTWTTLDYKNNDATMTHSNTTYSFTCTTKGTFKYFRIIQTAKNSRGDNCIAFNQIDLLGQIIIDSCKTFQSHWRISISYTFIALMHLST